MAMDDQSMPVATAAATQTPQPHTAGHVKQPRKRHAEVTRLSTIEEGKQWSCERPTCHSPTSMCLLDAFNMEVVPMVKAVPVMHAARRSPKMLAPLQTGALPAGGTSFMTPPPTPADEHGDLGGSIVGGQPECSRLPSPPETPATPTFGSCAVEITRATSTSTQELCTLFRTYDTVSRTFSETLIATTCRIRRDASLLAAVPVSHLGRLRETFCAVDHEANRCLRRWVPDAVMQRWDEERDEKVQLAEAKKREEMETRNCEAQEKKEEMETAVVDHVQPEQVSEFREDSQDSHDSGYVSVDGEAHDSTSNTHLPSFGTISDIELDKLVKSVGANTSEAWHLGMAPEKLALLTHAFAATTEALCTTVEFLKHCISCSRARAILDGRMRPDPYFDPEDPAHLAVLATSFCRVLYADIKQHVDYASAVLLQQAVAIASVLDPASPAPIRTLPVTMTGGAGDGSQRSPSRREKTHDDLCILADPPDLTPFSLHGRHTLRRTLVFPLRRISRLRGFVARSLAASMLRLEGETDPDLVVLRQRLRTSLFEVQADMAKGTG